MNPDEIFSFIKNNRLSIIVKPNASKTKIVEYDSDRVALRVDVAAIPDKNKANDELVKFFSKLLKKKVTIKSGLTSRKKCLEIIWLVSAQWLLTKTFIYYILSPINIWLRINIQQEIW